jgi:hypothetical protein
VRRKDGTLAVTPRVIWARPQRRPKAIRCHPRKHHPGSASPQAASAAGAREATDVDAHQAEPGRGRVNRAARQQDSDGTHETSPDEELTE